MEDPKRLLIRTVLENVYMSARAHFPPCPWPKGDIEYLKKMEEHLYQQLLKK